MSWKPSRGMRGGAVGLASMTAFLLGLAGAASALDGLPLSGGAEPAEVAAAAEAGCPALTRIKYPFLSCQRDAHGNAALEPFGAVVSSPGHLFGQDPFVQGDGYWGPDR